MLADAAAPMLAVAAVALAAKAHGRQVRLRREAHGVHAVDFRGANPPVVEALWRRDRRGFWSLAAAYAAAAWAAGALGGSGLHPVALVATLACAALAAAFLTMAAWWSLDLRRAGGEARPGPPGWPWVVGAALALGGALGLAFA